LLKVFRRIFIAFSIIVTIRLLLIHFLARIIDKRLNKVRVPPLHPVREETITLHKRLFIADLHSDPYLWNRNLLERHNYGHIDVPRLIEGNVALQTVGVATKIPWGLNFESNPENSDMVAALVITQGWPIRTWRSLYQRAHYHAERLQALIAEAPEDLMLIRSVHDLNKLVARRKKKPAALGFLLGIEGVHALEGNLSNLDKLYAVGFRLLGLAHFFDNEAGGSAHGVKKGGLSSFGMILVRAAEARMMIIDLAHASERLIEHVCAIATRPLIVSHTGVRGTCNTQRNLSDRHIKLIAESGGLIGIAMFEGALREATLSKVVEAMQYVADLVGVDHVAIGSDFDGATTTPIDASGMPYLTESLLDAGFSDEEISKIMGGNILRFLRQTLPDVA